jgi:hypothetical protein
MPLRVGADETRIHNLDLQLPATKLPSARMPHVPGEHGKAPAIAIRDAKHTGATSAAATELSKKNKILH